MNRYDAAGVEAEYEPGSRRGVLRNKLGIRTKREMDHEESRLFLLAQRKYLTEISVNLIFTAGLIRCMHGDWLGTMYEWAGQYRTVNVSKGNFAWPPAMFVADNMNSFEQKILRRVTPCHCGDVETLCLVLSEVQAEFLLVHPFREGNGRTARWLTDLMATQAGFPILEYGFRAQKNGPHEKEYLNGVIAGYAKDYERLARFLRAAVLRALERDRNGR